MTVITDDFNRANNPLSLGSTPDGHPWTTHVGTAGILSNEAYWSAGATGGINGGIATINAGGPAGVVQVLATVSPPAGEEAGVTFRLSDVNNFWVAYVWRRISPANFLVQTDRIQAGVLTNVTSEILGAAPPSPFMLHVELDGDSGYLYRSRVATDPPSPGLILSGSWTSSFNNTATRHGLHLYGGTTQRLDDFLVDAVTASWTIGSIRTG